MSIKKQFYCYESETSSCDFLYIYYYYPALVSRSTVDEWTDNKRHTHMFSANTQIGIVIKESVGWDIYFLVLGFGFSLNRQYGY